MLWRRLSRRSLADLSACTTTDDSSALAGRGASGRGGGVAFAQGPGASPPLELGRSSQRGRPCTCPGQCGLAMAGRQHAVVAERRPSPERGLRQAEVIPVDAPSSRTLALVTRARSGASGPPSQGGAPATASPQRSPGFCRLSSPLGRRGRLVARRCLAGPGRSRRARRWWSPRCGRCGGGLGRGRRMPHRWRRSGLSGRRCRRRG